MRGGTACAAWGLAGILALAGCSGDEEAGGLSPSSPPADTSSAPTSSASTAPPDGPPKLPAVARQHTNAGAKAFVRYYIDVLNYAYMNARPNALARVSPKACDLCSAGMTVLRRLARAGGEQRGGRMAATKVVVGPFEPDTTRIYFAKIHVSPGSSRGSADSPFTPIKEQNFMLEFDLRWVATAWTIEDIRPT
jgi:hypothetical protein